METIASILAPIIFIASVVCGCLIAFIIIWHFAREDMMKEFNKYSKFKEKK